MADPDISQQLKIVMSRLALALCLANQAIDFHGLSKGIGLFSPLASFLALPWWLATLFLLCEFFGDLLLCLDDLHLLIFVQVIINSCLLSNATRWGWLMPLVTCALWRNDNKTHVSCRECSHSTLAQRRAARERHMHSVKMFSTC